MSDTITVALLGFGPLESRQLEAGLRDLAHHAGRGVAFEPACDAVGATGADLVVADVDDPETTDLVRRLGLLGRTVGVGSRPLPCVACQLARPLDVAAVVDALARLAPSRTPVATSASGGHVARVLEQLAFFVDRAERAERAERAAPVRQANPASSVAAAGHSR